MWAYLISTYNSASDVDFLFLHLLPGLYSIDYGSNTNCVNSVKNISWVLDGGYITNGVNRDVPSAHTYYPMGILSF
jgi:hypothetical protein